MIIIPARLGSTRFARKILCDFGGVPLFIATARVGAEALGQGGVVIAADEEEVAKIARKQGFEAVLTDKKHESGTDRINEACAILTLRDDELIINLQADEPLFEPENLLRFIHFCEANLGQGRAVARGETGGGAGGVADCVAGKDEAGGEGRGCGASGEGRGGGATGAAARSAVADEIFMASCVKKISREEAEDPNLVKALMDKNGLALYFSRASLPFEREKYEGAFWGHLGIYGYTVGALRDFCAFAPSPLERAEKLEQLRAIENGKKIKLLEIQTQSFGIDTREDYERALARVKKDKNKT